MNALDCTDIKALLSALIDDQLDDHTRHFVERHLAECKACRSHINEAERLDALIAMSAELERHRAPDLPRGFEQAVLAQTTAGYGQRRSAPATVGVWTGWLAAAASLALAAVLWMDDRSEPRASEVAMGGPAMPVDPEVAAAQEPHVHVEPRPHIVRYATGANLQSSTSEVAFASPEELRPSARPASSAPILGDPRRLPEADLRSSGMAQYAALGAERSSARGARPAPAISREEADAIYNVSLLMNVLADADLASFADIERIRRVAVADELLDWLAEAREHVDPADRPALLAAEGILLRIVNGPLDREDVRLLRETVAQLDLSEEVGEITRRWDAAHSL